MIFYNFSCNIIKLISILENAQFQHILNQPMSNISLTLNNTQVFVISFREFWSVCKITVIFRSFMICSSIHKHSTFWIYMIKNSSHKQNIRKVYHAAILVIFHRLHQRCIAFNFLRWVGYNLIIIPPYCLEATVSMSHLAHRHGEVKMKSFIGCNQPLNIVYCISKEQNR